MADTDLAAIATKIQSAQLQNSIGVAAMRMMRQSEQQVANLLDQSVQQGGTAAVVAPAPLQSSDGDRGQLLDITV